MEYLEMGINYISGLNCDLPSDTHYKKSKKNRIHWFYSCAGQ